MNAHPLEPLFRPRTIAVAGASARIGSLGKVVWESLRGGGFEGPLYAVNPKYDHVGASPCAKDFSHLPRGIDLAVVCVPAEHAVDVVNDAAAHGARTAVVLTAGFRETGEEGKAREEALVQAARSHGMRLLGPNCVGLQRPDCKLNASFAATPAKPGDVALLSQSGAICTALVDAAWRENFGFSSVVSLGAGADVDFGEALEFLAQDAATRSILLYVEGVRNARGFMSSLRSAARAKPVLVLKAGRQAEGARAALSHTGALVGNDRVFSAALARCGAVRVDAYEELFAAARGLGLSQVLRGDRLAIVTNGGGPGVLAADAAREKGLKLATLSEATRARLKALLPAHAAIANPVDIIGDADGSRFEASLETVLQDDDVDGIVLMHCPTRVVPAQAVASVVAPLCRAARKPVLTVWLGDARGNGAGAVLEASGVPAFDGPGGAVAAFGALAAYRRNQEQLRQAPPSLALDRNADFDAARSVFAGVLAQGRTLLTEPESKTVLAACGLPVPDTRVAADAGEAVRAADAAGYPVVLKVLSPDVSHKSDVDGVRLGILDAGQVRAQFESIRAALARHRPDARFQGVAVQPMIRRKHARELLIGVARDAAFGPVITCGSGGVAVELLEDFAVALPPLNAALAERLLADTRAGRLLKAHRDVPAASRHAVHELLLRVSDMACHLPQLAEMDLNPVLADAAGAIVLDARIVLNASMPARPDGRYSHLAIHPYPGEWESRFKTLHGAALTLRPIRPEDAERESLFIRALSPQSRYFRFLSGMREAAPDAIARFTQIDYDREMALVACREGDAGEQFLGVARYVCDSAGKACEFALAVSDAWHGQGVGTGLMRRLIEHAEAHGVERMWGFVLMSNATMLRLTDGLGFTRGASGESGMVRVEKNLGAPKS